MRRLGAGSALAAGVLLTLWLTLRDGPQPKPTGPDVRCAVITALCPDSDGGLRYRVATVSAEPLDAGQSVEERIAAFADLLASRGCVRAGPVYQDLDGGACVAQPNAVRVRDLGDVAWPCRCASDAGWLRVPCVLLAGRHDPRELGCEPGANVQEAP